MFRKANKSHEFETLNYLKNTTQKLTEKNKNKKKILDKLDEDAERDLQNIYKDIKE